MSPRVPTCLVTDVTITNPLVLYRALLAAKTVQPDPAQHALSVHLQKLYHRLKDYSPHHEYRERLQQVREALATRNHHPHHRNDSQTLAVHGHALRRNPLFARFFGQKTDTQASSRALTRVWSSHEAAMKLSSPKGLLLHGEVGVGKSMLVDLLADSLPTAKKRRWHFDTFMLEMFARLELLRRSDVAPEPKRRKPGQSDAVEYSLLTVAKELIDKSPIIFLDEFQLPDRTASRLLSSLFTLFFELGGVLIATSNRLPEELEKAAGLASWELDKSKSKSWWRRMNAGRQRDAQEDFVELLKTRCEIREMKGVKDWRRWQAIDGEMDTTKAANNDDSKTPFLPKNYFLSSDDASLENAWIKATRNVLPADTPNPIPWEMSEMTVYGRCIRLQKTHQGVVYASFDELCAGLYGPADYISMASAFHTFILDHVPTMYLTHKNEARRFITLLDALYEARCKLVIRAETHPDELFFPETRVRALPPDTNQSDLDTDDAVYPETIAEIYQDQTSPFRPNITSYKAAQARAAYDINGDAHAHAPAYQDADFGAPRVDFTRPSSFTGEDERFAYKRASSRLWEMCGARWHARPVETWWRPLPREARHWQRVSGLLNEKLVSDTCDAANVPVSDVTIGESVDLDGHAGLQGIVVEDLRQRERA